MYIVGVNFLSRAFKLITPKNEEIFFFLERKEEIIYCELMVSQF